MATDTVTTDVGILTTVIAPNQADMDPNVAHSLLDLRFSEDQNERMRELVDRHNRGILSESEQIELESYRRVGNFLSIMQAKARRSLNQASNGQ